MSIKNELCGKRYINIFFMVNTYKIFIHNGVLIKCWINIYT